MYVCVYVTSTDIYAHLCMCMRVRVCVDSCGYQLLGSPCRRRELALGSRSPDLHLLRGLPSVGTARPAKSIACCTFSADDDGDDDVDAAVAAAYLCCS